jgi:hypothetical protein
MTQRNKYGQTGTWFGVDLGTQHFATDARLKHVSFEGGRNHSHNRILSEPIMRTESPKNRRELAR